MFTGIVEEMGAVKAVEKTSAGVRATILASKIMADLTAGASVSVNGVCLTAVDVTPTDFTVDISAETLALTTWGRAAAGLPVNLERAMRFNDRLGGHLVAGHVDGVGVIRGRRQEGNTLWISIEAPKEVLRFCIVKGSVAVDGISLTITEVGERAFGVAIIPHTAALTTLGLKQAGDEVNLEADLVGKYIERLLAERGSAPPKAAPTIDADYLKKRGLI